MSELWRVVFNWASALGAGTSGANVAASVTNVLALVTAAWMFCFILVRVSRRVMATLSWSKACKEKAALFVRSASRFLFAWILSSYIYDAMGVFQLLAAPVSRISSVIAILLCAAMLAIVVWATLAWVFGIPTSESHALIAGLTGSASMTRNHPDTFTEIKDMRRSVESHLETERSKGRGHHVGDGPFAICSGDMNHSIFTMRMPQHLIHELHVSDARLISPCTNLLE